MSATRDPLSEESKEEITNPIFTGNDFVDPDEFNLLLEPDESEAEMNFSPSSALFTSTLTSKSTSSSSSSLFDPPGINKQKLTEEKLKMQELADNVQSGRDTNPACQFEFAAYYYEKNCRGERSKEEDEKIILHFLHASAAQGHYEAMAALVNVYSQEFWLHLRLTFKLESVKKDPAQTVEWVNKIIAQYNDASAHYILGKIYEEGYVVEKNLGKAITHYEQAMKLGYDRAPTTLFEIYSGTLKKEYRKSHSMLTLYRRKRSECLS